MALLKTDGLVDDFDTIGPVFEFFFLFAPHTDNEKSDFLSSVPLRYIFNYMIN